MYPLGLKEVINLSEGLRGLLTNIEKCLKCYEKFKDYSEEDRVRIRRWYNEGPWFFPPYDGVKGFFGTNEVMFVCQKPSTQPGTFPRKRSNRLYKLLKENGLGNAHLTDLVKCRGLAGRLTKEQINNCLPYLKEEIALLQPKLIVAVGNEVFKTLRKLELPARLEKIPHYAPQYEKKNFAVELENALKRIKEVNYHW